MHSFYSGKYVDFDKYDNVFHNCNICIYNMYLSKTHFPISLLRACFFISISDRNAGCLWIQEFLLEIQCSFGGIPSIQGSQKF